MEINDLIFDSLEESESLTPRQRKPEVKVAHKNDVGRLVYEIIGKNAPPLYYARCNAFVSDMLQDGWQWWAIEHKLKDALMWCKSKGVSHAGLRTTLNKIREKK